MAYQGTALKSSCVIFLSALHLRPQGTSGPLAVRRLVDGFNERRIQKIFPGWQLCVDESVSSWRGI